jgi:hypothetical protein
MTTASDALARRSRTRYGGERTIRSVRQSSPEIDTLQRRTTDGRALAAMLRNLSQMSRRKMMLYRWPALLALLLTTSAQAVDFPIQVIEYVDDIKVVASIDEADMADEQPWHPFTDEPPLSVAQALKAVAEAIAGDTALADARLTEIELRRVPHHENHWHYMVKLQTEAPSPHHNRYYVVLMSGKVVPALKAPQPVM